MFRSRGRFAVVDGLSLVDLEALLQLADGTRNRESVIAGLGGRLDATVVGSIIDTIRDLSETAAPDNLFRPLVLNPDSEASVEPVIVVGTGRLAQTISGHLSRNGFAHVRVIEASLFASIVDDTFQEALASRTFRRSSASRNAAADDTTPWTVDGLAAEFKNARLVVCALEGTLFRAVLDVNAAAVAAGRPTIFVTLDTESVHVGPTYVPTRTACFECVNLGAPPAIRASLELFELDLVGVRDSIDRVLDHVVIEAQAVLRGTRAPQTLTRVVSFPRRMSLAGASEWSPLVPAGPGSCVCENTSSADLSARLLVDADLALINSRADEPRLNVAGQEVPDPYRTVGVIGGGTAGYFTALALKAKLPHLDVTLVESSKIPIIGVGESTTPDIMYFLHGDLGFDLYDFYCTVRPTWKMGIKFFWGKPGDYYFNEPFARPRHSEALHYDGDINTSSFVSELMSHELGPLLDTDKGPVFLLEQLSQGHMVYPQWCAYHLDNKRFVAYLAAQAKARGIPYIDTQVQGAVKTADGQEIDYLVTEDGRHLKFDLFVDCTGFRSSLLEKEMGSKFVSFDRSLFTDTAVVADVPHGGHLKPYTLAESMEWGWCWNIPQEESDHRGYVFSSRFGSVEEAAAEMRRKNPGMSDYWTVKFRSGRHEDFWKGNVIGIGNSYGFVEPLESTAIQIVILELQTLIRNFPTRKSDETPKRVIRHKVAGAWDYIRWFLSIHYKFNRKFSNAFWDECHRTVDISGIAELVELFKERAPLLTRHDVDLIRTRLTSDDLTFNLALVDTMLLGQGVPTRLLQEPLESKQAWQRRAAATKRLLGQAVSQRRALEILRERPEILGSIKISGLI